MSEKLHCIYFLEDGGIIHQEIDDFDLWMKKNFDGCKPPKFLSTWPKDWQCEGGSYLLLRARVVTPKPVETVTRYVIE